MCRPRRHRAQSPASRSALHGPGLEGHPPERSREQPQPLRTIHRAADLGGRLPPAPAHHWEGRQGRVRAPGAPAPKVGLASCSPQEGPASSVSAPVGAWPGPSPRSAGLQDTWGRPACLGESVPGEAHAGRLVPSAQTSPWATSAHHRAPCRAPPTTPLEETPHPPASLSP